MKDPHKHWLNYLISHLEEVEENKYEALWIMKEGIWLKKSSKNSEKNCDLVIGYPDFVASCLELKSYRSGLDYAILQLETTSNLVNEYLNYNVINKKIVYYGLGKLEFDCFK